MWLPKKLSALALYPISEYRREALYLQTAVIVACFAWPLYKPIVPGVAIGFLGVVAAIMAVRAERFTKVEIGVWILICFGLFFVEIDSVYKDRDEHDKQQAKSRAEELDARQKQERSFSDLLRAARDLLGTTQTVSKLAKNTLENITGEGSVGYIVPQWNGTFALHNDGQHILSVATVIIEHHFEKVYQSGSVGTVPANELVVLPSAQIPSLDFLRGDSLTSFITAQNGEFSEVITFRRGTKGRPFEYRFEVRKHIELCRPDKHPNESSLIDCPHGLSEDRLVYMRNWSDEPQLSSSQLRKLLNRR
jgi:hypothetical protein